MRGRFIDGGHRDSRVEPYSDRKHMREFEDEPLPIELVVKVQQLAARGRTVDEIVAELAEQRVARADIIRALEPSEASTPRQPHRPQRAGVGYARVKRGFPGYGR